MADLQEECFGERHLRFFLMLTLPQIFIVVIGLPIAAFVLIKRSTPEEREQKSFHMRYGLLYLGYREERAWWEVIVAVRKIFVVAISTFGILLGRVDVQAFLALGIVFMAIVFHSLGVR